jgi:hypothetical protein
MATRLTSQVHNCSVFNIILADRFGSSSKVYDSCSGDSTFEPSMGHALSWLSVSYFSHPQSCRTNCGIGHQIIPIFLPSTFSKLLHSFYVSFGNMEDVPGGRSILWEVIVSVILIKNVYVHVSYSERFPK